MFRRILVPLDGSPPSGSILQCLHAIRGGRDPELILLHVLGPGGRGKARDVRHRKAVAQKDYLAHIQARLRAQGVRATRAVRIGEPAEVILNVCARSHSSLIAMFAHGRTGLRRWVRGSVTESVLRRSPVPLLVVNPQAVNHFGPQTASLDRVLVPLDGSKQAEEILPIVEEMADRHGSEILLLNSELLQEYPDVTVGRDHQYGRAVLKPCFDRLRAGGDRVGAAMMFGRAREEILKAARERDVDLVAMTTHGRTGFFRWFYGSVAENVLRESPCPVLVKRAAGRSVAEVGHPGPQRVGALATQRRFHEAQRSR